MNDPLDKLSFDEEQYQENESRQKKYAQRAELDRRICGCGHPIARHKRNTFVKEFEAYTCQPPNVGSICTCRIPRPVLEVPNTKRFLRKAIADGGSAGHPLLRGIRAVKEKSEDEYRRIEWLIPLTCDKCGSEDVKVTPIGFNKLSETYAPDNKAGDVTVFLCDPCRFPVDTSENLVIDSEDDN